MTPDPTAMLSSMPQTSRIYLSGVRRVQAALRAGFDRLGCDNHEQYQFITTCVPAW